MQGEIIRLVANTQESKGAGNASAQGKHPSYFQGSSEAFRTQAPHISDATCWPKLLSYSGVDFSVICPLFGSKHGELRLLATCLPSQVSIHS